MASKKIKLTGTVIRKDSYDTKSLLTTLSCTSRFDQNTADAMGIKESIYDDQGVRRPGVHKWVLEWELFGADINIMPHQEAMFGDKPLTITAVQMTADDVLKQDADGSLKMNFTVIVASAPPSVRDFLLVVKRGECACTIEKPTKAVENDAKQQAANFGLFKAPKEETTEEEEGEPENPPTDKGEKESGALASHAVMGEKTIRGRGRHKAK
jgi:hypothetical protein